MPEFVRPGSKSSVSRPGSMSSSTRSGLASRAKSFDGATALLSVNWRFLKVRLSLAPIPSTPSALFAFPPPPQKTK
jgi:hypothetical protein